VARPTISPRAYRRLTLGAVLLLAAIVVSGAAVRLTGSGLGCPDWPNCENGRLVAPLEKHALVEFTNRTITGLVSVAVILAVLGSMWRVPRRRDLIWLSWGLVAGVLAQIVLGGVTVLVDLSPPFVMAHFLLSMALLADAVVLHDRACQRGGPRRRVVVQDVATAVWVLVGAAVLVLFTGTIVTGSGPHGGDENVRRLSFFIPDVARLHGASVMLFLALTLLALWLMRRTSAPSRTQQRGRWLVYAICVQAAIGYTQYFTGVPVLLVGFHIAGAVCVWTATVALASSLSRSGGDGVEELERGIDEPEVLGRGEVVGAREGDQTRVG
jgi:cytochrome c oxidase assembly protein subunit 15